jgi:hypothetical protein
VSKVLICLNFRRSIGTFFFIFLCWSTFVFGQDNSTTNSVAVSGYEDSKELTVEWEPVEGSVGYELDVYGLSESGFVPLGLFKVKHDGMGFAIKSW